MLKTIKGYVKGLGDKYTEYYTKDEWKEFEEEALGNYKGIGIYMSQNAEDNIDKLSRIYYIFSILINKNKEDEKVIKKLCKSII